MPGFLLTVGDNHLAIARQATKNVAPDLTRGVGTAGGIQTTTTLSLCEWHNEERGFQPDLVWTSDEASAADIFLVGYATEPLAISRKHGLTSETSLLQIGKGFVAGPESQKSLLNELNGSYCLIIVDRKELSVVVCSDRWASRTVWRTFVNGTWCLASHPALLWQALGRKSPIEAASLGSLLLRARPLGDRCLLSGLTRNLPGHVHHLSLSGNEYTSCWHRPVYEPAKGVKSSEWEALLAETLRRSATRLKGVMERPLLFLSGGLDSRLALASLRGVFDVVAVTLQDSENFETKIAREVASALGVTHKIVKRDRSYYLRVMGQSALLQGGIYHPAHSHFSEGLRLLENGVGYDSVLLGDFLEAFQKLFGDDADSLPEGISAEGLYEHIFQLDGKYASHDAGSGLAFLLPSVRDRVFEEWRVQLLATIREALEVTSELPLTIDYLLRWRAAYELATYCMIEDVRSYGPERCLSMDNELYDLMLSMPAKIRKGGRLSPAAIRRLAPRLAHVQNANTMLPASAPHWCHKAVKVVRPKVGTLRRKFNYAFGITGAAMSSSWSDCRLLAAKDQSWIEYIEDRLFDQEGLPDTIFDRKVVEGLWKEFRAGNFSRAFSLDSLLTFALVHKRYGSGVLS